MPIIQAQPALKVKIIESDRECDVRDPLLEGSVSARVLQATGNQLPLMWSMMPDDQLPKCAAIVVNDELRPYRASIGSGQVGQPLSSLVNQPADAKSMPYLHLTANLGMECDPESADMDVALKADGQCHPYGHGDEPFKHELKRIGESLGQHVPDDIDVSSVWYKASCDAEDGPSISICGSSCSTDAPTESNGCFVTIPLDALMDQCFNPMHGLPGWAALAAANHHVRRMIMPEEDAAASGALHQKRGMHALRRTLRDQMIPISMQLSCVYPTTESMLPKLPVTSAPQEGLPLPPHHPHPHHPHPPHHAPPRRIGFPPRPPCDGAPFDPETMDAIMDGLNMLAFFVLPLLLVTVLLATRRRLMAERVAVLAVQQQQQSPPTSPASEKVAPPAYAHVAKTQQVTVDGKKVQYETVSTQSQE